MQSCLLTPFKGVNTEAIGFMRSFLIAYKEVRYSLLHYLLLSLLIVYNTVLQCYTQTRDATIYRYIAIS